MTSRTVSSSKKPALYGHLFGPLAHHPQEHRDAVGPSVDDCITAAVAISEVNSEFGRSKKIAFLGGIAVAALTRDRLRQYAPPNAARAYLHFPAPRDNPAQERDRQTAGIDNIGPGLTSPTPDELTAQELEWDRLILERSTKISDSMHRHRAVSYLNSITTQIWTPLTRTRTRSTTSGRMRRIPSALLHRQPWLTDFREYFP